MNNDGIISLITTALAANCQISLTFTPKAFLGDADEEGPEAHDCTTQLPDHDGLWYDNTDNLWWISSDTAVCIREDGDWSMGDLEIAKHSIKSGSISMFAPFRPATVTTQGKES